MAAINTEVRASAEIHAQQKADRRSQWLRQMPSSTLWYLILIIGAIASLFPYAIALITSLKPASQLFVGAPWTLPPTPTLQNYVTVWTQYNFPQYLLNTIIFASLTTLGQLIFSTFAAYAFARLRFPGRDIIFWLYLATTMVPNIVTLVPLFILMRTLHWIDSYAGLLAPFILGTPYGIFLMRQFFRSIPEDLENSARIEGASTLQIIWQIFMPLSRPILATLAVITFVQGWNNFIWPLIITNSDSLRVLTVGISSFQSDYGADWNLMMAATFIALGPLLVLFFLFQKHIVRSIHLSGFK
jgi:multiple sugar transport system permease protein